MPPADTVTINVGDILKKWKHQLIKAQHFSNDESTLYPLIDSVLNAFMLLIDTDDETTISCHPQPRLSGNSYEHVKSLTDALSAIPDFALVLDHFRGHHFEYTRHLLLFEIKRLLLPPLLKMNGLLQYGPYSSWFDPYTRTIAETEFINHLDQIMLQGFVGWHVYDKQDDIYLVLITGIYCTVLCFTCPRPNLAPLPIHPTRVDRTLITQTLIPRNHRPKPLVFMRSMFRRDTGGAIELTDDFRRLLYFGLQQGSHTSPADVQSCSLFYCNDPSTIVLDISPAEESICMMYMDSWYDQAAQSHAAVTAIIPQSPPREGSRSSYADATLSPGNPSTPESSPYVPKRHKRRKLSDDDFGISINRIDRRKSRYKEGMP